MSNLSFHYISSVKSVPKMNAMQCNVYLIVISKDDGISLCNH
jgi:hypothetical protein